jgi:ribosomal protein S8E
MVVQRVQRRRAASARPAASARHKELLTNGSKPSYTIILEQVMQQKKKMITEVCTAGIYGPNFKDAT